MPFFDPVDGRVVGRFADEFVEVFADVVDAVVCVDEPPELLEPLELPEPVLVDPPDPSWPQLEVDEPAHVAPPPVSGATDGVGSAAKAGAAKNAGPVTTHSPIRPLTTRYFMASPIRSQLSPHQSHWPHRKDNPRSESEGIPR